MIIIIIIITKHLSFTGVKLSTTLRFVSVSVQLVDYRVEFSKWWVSEFKTIKFPSQDTVFDYYIDPETKKFEPWSKIVPKFEMDPDIPLQVFLFPLDWKSFLMLQ